MNRRSWESSRRLRNALQSYFGALVAEPPHERWADLIERLNDENATCAEPKRCGKKLRFGRARRPTGRKRSSSTRTDG
jgi:hypothetical protein